MCRRFGLRQLQFIWKPGFRLINNHAKFQPSPALPFLACSCLAKTPASLSVNTVRAICICTIITYILQSLQGNQRDADTRQEPDPVRESTLFLQDKYRKNFEKYSRNYTIYVLFQLSSKLSGLKPSEVVA